MKKFILSLLTLALLVTAPQMTNAATKTITTRESSVQTVKKTGTYTLKQQSTGSKKYFYFKAPKSGTYTFKFSDMTYKGEAEDVQTEEYWAEADSAEYGRYFIISPNRLSHGDWTPIEMKGSGVKPVQIVNYYYVLCAVSHKNGYDNLTDAYTDLTDGRYSDKELMKMLSDDGMTACEWTITLPIKKGQKIRFNVADGFKSAQCTLKITRK